MNLKGRCKITSSSSSGVLTKVAPALRSPFSASLFAWECQFNHVQKELQVSYHCVCCVDELEQPKR